jgi:twinkle protein
VINQLGEAWLEQRGLDIERAIRSGLYTTSHPGGDPDDGDDAGWIAIPYSVDGEIVNVKFRKLANKEFAQIKGGAQVLYNRDVLRDATLADHPLIICEGELDALAAMAAGYLRVVSVPGGAPSEAGKKSHAYIDEAIGDLREVRRIILAVDSDEPGCNLRDDLIARLGKARCWTIRYPRGCKDLGDALRLYGVRGVRAAIDTAQETLMEGLVTLDQLPPTPALSPAKVVSLGCDFQKHVGICPGHLSIWTGLANRGKSTLMRAVCHALAVEKGWRIAVASFEDDIRRDYVPAMQRLFSRGWPDTEERQQRSLEWIGDHFRFILPPEEDTVTIPYLLEQMEGAVIRHGVNMIVIDPWTELDLQLSGGTSETEAVRVYIAAIRRFAVRFHVHVAILAHPRKPPEWGGKRKMPDGYDISGSAHFVNRCDLGVSVEADQSIENVSNVRVWKSKYREVMGPIGDFALNFSPATRRFTELSFSDLAELRGETE